MLLALEMHACDASGNYQVHVACLFHGSIPHKHIHGVCPFQLSMVDVVSKVQRDQGLPPQPPLQQPIDPNQQS